MRRATLLIVPLVGLLMPEIVTGQFVEKDLVVLRTLTGELAGEFFGYVANPIADLDGDGADELIVGAPFANAVGPGAGRAYLISGATGATLKVFEGTTREFLGSAVNDAGDVNNDGIHDIVLGGPGQPFSFSPSVNGRVSVYSGAPPYPLIWEVTGEALNDFFGHSVAGLMDDLDRDGFNDVLATATLHDSTAPNGGRAYVLSGADGTILQRLETTGSLNQHGSAVASIQDLDDDGVRDVVVGARDDGPGREGRVLIQSSGNGATIRTLEPLAGATNLGWFFMNAVGDANDDGVDDIYVSDFGDTSLGAQTGRAYIFSGSDGTRIRDWQGAGAGAGFGIGRMVADVNDDGATDLFVAAWVGDAGAPNAGQGFVLSGRDGAVLQTMTCNINNTQAGYDACGLNDVNDDGRADYVLTGQGRDAAAIARGDGVVYILAGQIGRVLGDLNCDGVVSVGDINAFVLALTDPDGYADQFPDCDRLNGDINDDNDVTVSDINGFVALLTA